MDNPTIIVPCFNEEKRLPYEKFIEFSNNNNVNFFFVNDGSSDDTEKLLNLIIAKTKNNSLINLDHNVGKAEAIRICMLEALNKYETNFYGFWDADLATPLNEISYLMKYFESENNIMVFGSRFKRLGNKIERSVFRHYCGRVIATFISMILNMGVYDTQCGAKIINKKYLKVIFEKPFYTKWLFDVEIFFRIKKFNHKDEKIIEVPLNSWSDISNSKITIIDIIKTPINLLKIIFFYNLKKMHKKNND